MTLPKSQERSQHVYDLVVVGGGVVGLAILREATLYGWSCALVEKEPDLLTWASGSNSGIICTGVDAAEGTLERALIRDSISRIRSYCKYMNIPMRPCGSLVCRWPWDEENDDDEPRGLQSVVDESHEAGDTHARYLTPEEVERLEPCLNKSCLGAVHIPGEIVVDPWLFSISLAVQARANGADIFTNFSFDAKKSYLKEGIWHIHPTSIGDKRVPSSLACKAVVSATGLWADLIQKQVNAERAMFTSRPRRGQYNVYSSTKEARTTHPIQPIPTDRTKGIFVFTTVYDQVVVGPTALEQESKIDRRIDENVAKELDDYARKVVPKIRLDTKVGEYVGIRPGTDHRDYQVHQDFRNRWVTVAGVRSTGLTASLGIGRHIREMLRTYLLEPGPIEPASVRLPDVVSLLSNFHDRGDGSVAINDFEYKVTHPLTRLGWEDPKQGLNTSSL